MHDLHRVTFCPQLREVQVRLAEVVEQVFLEEEAAGQLAPEVVVEALFLAGLVAARADAEGHEVKEEALGHVTSAEVVLNTNRPRLKTRRLGFEERKGLLEASVAVVDSAGQAGDFAEPAA